MHHVSVPRVLGTQVCKRINQASARLTTNAHAFT